MLTPGIPRSGSGPGVYESAMAGCQPRAERAHLRHMACGLVAFYVLKHERHVGGLSIYKLKRQLVFKGRSFAFPALERLRGVA